MPATRHNTRQRHARTNQDQLKLTGNRDLQRAGGSGPWPTSAGKGLQVRYRSGGGGYGGGEGDGVAEGFELADQVAGLALGVDLGVVPAGAEVGEAGGAVGEQVEDDDQDGAGDRGQRFALAA